MGFAPREGAREKGHSVAPQSGARPASLPVAGGASGLRRLGCEWGTAGGDDMGRDVSRSPSPARVRRSINAAAGTFCRKRGVSSAVTSACVGAVPFNARRNHVTPARPASRAARWSRRLARLPAHRWPRHRRRWPRHRRVAHRTKTMSPRGNHGHAWPPLTAVARFRCARVRRRTKAPYRPGARTNIDMIDAERLCDDASQVAIAATRQAALDLLLATGTFR